VVIPARNERGNIAAAVERMVVPAGCRLEVLFVEGGSTDGTWEEIQRVCAEPAAGRGFSLRALRQTGRGKNDAVRLGFSQATGDVLTILDADLTMPPEILGRFYDAYRHGIADFVNGSRLVYPMEGEAMRPLNRLANIFFAKALSHVLDVRLGDSLCGTKLVARHDYARIVAWRNDFGDFDPFGDFDLIFGAAKQNLKIIETPIHYKARTFGETQISRFRDGWLLLKMVWFAYRKLKAV
jgi:glycosyltransferase involved in cell wall biosynthesis